MRQLLTIARFSLRDLGRSRLIAGYTLFFAAVVWALFHFGQQPAQAVASLLDLVLLVVSLVSSIVGVLYFYNARDYAALMLTQPIARRTVFIGQYLGLSLSLGAAFSVGLGVPLFWYGMGDAQQVGTMLLLLLTGIFLTLIFTAIAFAVAVRTENRLKALGGVTVLWLFLAVIYDGFVLVVIMTFPDYPLALPLAGFALLNPLDMARILILLRLDIAALMGYTGAVFRQVIGTVPGIAIAIAALSLWTALPILLGVRSYDRRDF